MNASFEPWWRHAKLTQPAHRAPVSWLPIVLGACLLGGCVVYDGPPRRAVFIRPAPVVVENQPVYYAAGSEVVADSAPPAPIQEVVTTSPGVEFVWIPGAWLWEGRWIWGPGRWERPPRPGAVWVPHHYEFRNGAHVFIRGGWR